MKIKLLILTVVILFILSACGAPENCPNGGAYVFTPTGGCVLGISW